MILLWIIEDDDKVEIKRYLSSLIHFSTSARYESLWNQIFNYGESQILRISASLDTIEVEKHAFKAMILMESVQDVPRMEEEMS